MGWRPATDRSRRAERVGGVGVMESSSSADRCRAGHVERTYPYCLVWHHSGASFPRRVCQDCDDVRPMPSSGHRTVSGLPVGAFRSSRNRVIGQCPGNPSGRSSHHASDAVGCYRGVTMSVRCSPRVIGQYPGNLSGRSSPHANGRVMPENVRGWHARHARTPHRSAFRVGPEPVPCGRFV